MTHPSFNVLTEPWIPVIRSDGRPDELGIRPCLEQADRIREIKHPSPIVEFGLYRLLVAFVLDALILAGRRPEIPADLRELIEDGSFATGLLDAYIVVCGNVFDLLHPERPFLQTPCPTNHEISPIQTLFMQMPSGSETIHWHHREADTSAASVVEVVGALTAVSPFMTQGGRGYSPSINGTSPLYAMPVGSSLFETLVLNLPTRSLGETAPSAAWMQRTLPKGRRCPTSLPDGLTWQPRQIKVVAQEAGDDIQICGVVFQPGFGAEGTTWTDPNLAYKWTDQGLDKIPMRQNRPLWRDAGPVCLLATGEHGRGNEKVSTRRPDVVECALSALGTLDVLRLKAYGVRAKQANIYEWMVSELVIPAALGRKPRLGALADRELQSAESSAILLRRAILALAPEFGREDQKPPPKRKKWDKRSIRGLADRCERGYWLALEFHFQSMLHAFAALDPDAPDDPAVIAEAAREWRDAIKTLATRQFNLASKDMDADADALERLVTARAHLTGALRKVLS